MPSFSIVWWWKGCCKALISSKLQNVKNWNCRPPRGYGRRSYSRISHLQEIWIPVSRSGKAGIFQRNRLLARLSSSEKKRNNLDRWRAYPTIGNHVNIYVINQLKPKNVMSPIFEKFIWFGFIPLTELNKLFYEWHSTTTIFIDFSFSIELIRWMDKSES